MVTQQYFRLEVLAALKREVACDPYIYLASIKCVVKCNGVKFMKHQLYIRIYQFVSAYQVRQKRECC